MKEREPQVGDYYRYTEIYVDGWIIGEVIHINKRGIVMLVVDTSQFYHSWCEDFDMFEVDNVKGNRIWRYLPSYNTPLWKAINDCDKEKKC